jgi:hypothetical protein
LNGLEQSEKFFYNIGLSMLSHQFSYFDGYAAGLTGEGSECFGYDDALSCDHDWGLGFCLWLNKADYDKFGAKIQAAYHQLSQMHDGVYQQKNDNGRFARRGVFEINAFYSQFTGLSHPPQTLDEWRHIPEESLAAATNGKIFVDHSGEFTAIREKLLAFYPCDIRLKKIAARTMIAGQSGQYNFARCLKRNDYVAAHYALSKFIETSISLIFLLNKRYKPFYKWMYRALQDVDIVGKHVAPMYQRLVLYDLEKTDAKIIIDDIEYIASEIIKELSVQKLSFDRSGFLATHGPIIHSKIADSDLIKANIMSD